MCKYRLHDKMTHIHTQKKMYRYKLYLIRLNVNYSHLNISLFIDRK